MILDPNLLREIDEKLVLIEEDPASRSLNDVVRETLEQDSLTHSNLLEYGACSRRKRRAEINNTRENLFKAWEIGINKYKGKLTNDLIIDVAKEVINGEKKINEYRNENVRITGKDAVMPPRSEKVIPQMERLLVCVNSEKLTPVEKAVLMHLHFMRIHPFIDGNGRTGRLLQNLILEGQGYAPTVIYSGERDFYQQLLREGIRGYQEREAESSFDVVWSDPTDISEKEGRFYGYLGSKINSSFDNQFSVISRLPTYQITLRGRREPMMLLRVRKIFQDYFRSRKLIGQARIMKGEEQRIEVRGNVCEVAVGKVLDKAGYKYKLTKK